MLTSAIVAAFPRFVSYSTQRKNFLMRKRYWLYYALISMGGVRGQIFILFAEFLIVEKIVDLAEMGSTSGVAFTTNHITTVVIKALVRLVWLMSPMIIFLIGTAMVFVSLWLARNIPSQPMAYNEERIGKVEWSFALFH